MSVIALRTVAALAATLLACASVWPVRAQERESDEYERNERWFYEQRAYPFGSIPSDARRKAWEAWRTIERRRAETREAGRPTGPPAAAPGRAWHRIGPSPTLSSIRAISPVSGRIRALALSPIDPDLVLAGGAVGGIWRSTDGGATFVPVSDDQVDLAVGVIRFAPSDPSIVYAAMGREYLGSGVLRSTDAGATWRRVSNNSLPTPGYSRGLAVDPQNPNRLYLAQYAGLDDDGTVVSSGIYSSTDGGVSWTRTLAGLARDVAVDPGSPQTVYATIDRVDEGSSREPGIFRSTDGGKTWSHVYLGPFAPDRLPAFVVAVTPADPSRVYAVGAGVVGSVTIYVIAESTDHGRTWTRIQAPGLVAGAPSFLAASPEDPDTLYVGYPGGDTFRCRDAGRSWTCVTMGYCDGEFGHGDRIHVDQHAFAFSPSDSHRIYQANDGGLYASADEGENWQSLNASFSLTTFRSIAIDPRNPGFTVGGTQDNGTQRREPDSATWDEIISGDGGQIVFNALDPSRFYTTYIYGTVFKWSLDGRQFDGYAATNRTFGEPDSAPRIAFYPPFTGDGVTGRLYFGTWRLFTSADQGASWTAPAGTLDLTRGTSNGRDTLSAIGVGPANPDVIYTGSSQGRAMVSEDGGRTWRDVSAGLPVRYITWIAVERANPSVAYLTVSGFRTGHIFKTTNMGASWTDVSGLLPDIPVNVVHQDPVDPNTVYVGTDIGVFRSTSGGAGWESFNDGMPPAVVLGIASHPGGTIQVATYGRGAFELGPEANPTPTYTLAAPGGVVVERGKKVKIDIDVVRTGGFADEITLVAPQTKPSKLKVKPRQSSTTGDRFTATVKAKRSTPPGVYPVVLSARSRSGTLREATIAVTVE